MNAESIADCSPLGAIRARQRQSHLRMKYAEKCSSRRVERRKSVWKYQYVGCMSAVDDQYEQDFMPSPLIFSRG